MINYLLRFLLVSTYLFGTCTLAAVTPEEHSVFNDLRLFLTPDERWQLDNARRDLDKKIEPVVEKPKPKPVKRVRKKPKALPAVKLQGYVKRSSGESTVWINDRTTTQGEKTNEDLRLIATDKNGGNVQIKMPDKSLIELKPGQRFDPDGKKIVDSVE